MNILINWFTTSFAYLSIIRTVNHVIDCDFILTLLNIFILIFPTPVCSRPSMFRPSWEIKLGELFYFLTSIFLLNKRNFSVVKCIANRTRRISCIYFFLSRRKNSCPKGDIVTPHIFTLYGSCLGLSPEKIKKHKKNSP